MFAKPEPSRSVTPSPISATLEHQQLFASYANEANSNKRSYSGKGKGVGKGVLKKVATCTLKFVCLARMDASKAPSPIREWAMLNNADLREKSIQPVSNGQPTAGQGEVYHKYSAESPCQISTHFLFA